MSRVTLAIWQGLPLVSPKPKADKLTLYFYAILKLCQAISRGDRLPARLVKPRTRDPAAVFIKGPTVRGENNFRHSGQSAGQRAEQAGLRTVQVNNVRLFGLEQPVKRARRGKVG